VVPSEQAASFHETDQKRRSDCNNRERPDVGIGKRAIDRHSAEHDQAQNSDDIQRGHEDIPEGVALDSTGDAPAAIAESAVLGTSADFVVQGSDRLGVRHDLSTGKPDTLRRKVLARPLFRYAKKD
jgi:hypothetical protein